MIASLLYHLAGRHGRRRPTSTVISYLIGFAVVFTLSLWLCVMANMWQMTTQWDYQHWERRLAMSSSRMPFKSPRVSNDPVLLEENNDSSNPMSESLWKNQYNMVHVVNTRFMQHQAHLERLGEARMKLFESITLPSMSKQTTHEFLWFIRIDPKLSNKLKTRFLELMDRQENMVVVLSNTNPEGFRSSGMSDIATPNAIQGRTDRDRQGRFDRVRAYYRPHKVVSPSRRASTPMMPCRWTWSS